MGAWSLAEAQKLVDAASARAKAAEEQVAVVTIALALKKSELDDALEQVRHFDKMADYERNVSAELRQQILNEQRNLAAVNAKLDAANAQNDRYAAELQSRRLELGKIRDELTNERLRRIQLEEQRKAVGQFVREALDDAAPVYVVAHPELLDEVG